MFNGRNKVVLVVLFRIHVLNGKLVSENFGK